ncbi:MAG: hypothetical protein AAF497_11440 [Planctomycetota bacterium]
MSFNTGDPLGYFITWTCYGTWLPGDERGWRKRGRLDPLLPSQLFKEMAESDMKETHFLMSKQDQAIVEATVAKHCEIRNWHLHVVNARSNHVHVVVTAPGYDPETVSDQFKAWCTRKLKSLHVGRERFWTEGASRRWLNTEEELAAAILYASDEVQDRKGLAP